MSQVDQAVARFEEGFMCSQAIFSTYSQLLGLDPDTALRIAETFGGGMGTTGSTCGAVTGALMIIGLKHGRIDAQDSQSRDEAHRLAREFMEAFKARHESLVCSDLLDVNIGTPEGLQFARDNQLFHTRCPGFVRDAAELLEQIVLTGDKE